MNITFQTPPAELEGALYDYLYRLSRELNMALTNLDAGNFIVGSTAQAVVSGGESQKLNSDIKKQLGDLKSLIIKTADVIRSEVDRMEIELNSRFEAYSDYGTFKEKINMLITAMNGYVEQMIQYRADLEGSIGDVNQDLSRFIIETQGYIRSGIIGYDGAIPVIGIAIGQDLQVTGQEVVDGTVYPIIDKTSSMSIWTPGRLSFWLNGVEVGWFSGGALHCATIEIGDWQITTSNGLAIKWIGA